MAIDFPASPTLNDTFSSGGVTYTWDGTVWVASGSAAFVQKSGDTVTGNLTLNADLTVDTDTLYADSTNNSVGIGTSSPNTGLHFAAATPILTIEDTSGATAGVESTCILRNNDSFELQNRSSSNVFQDTFYSVTLDANGASQHGWRTGNTERMRIDSSGDVTISNDLAVNTDTLYVDTVNDRVGIGTASPSEALDIQGGMLINGANVTAVLSGAIADDSFYSLDLTAAGFILGGLATVTAYSTYNTFPQPIGTGFFYYDCGSSVTPARILADADAGAPLEGSSSTSTTITDFSDARATIICNSNTLRIANRLGGTRTFKLTFL